MKLPEACPNCERLARRLAEQDTEIATLKAQLAQALARITQLEQQLAAARKDSSTSSKPPSSDIVKPKQPLPKGGKKRKKGGQPGHEQHLRSPFPPEAVT
jgi:septal ring factor EnvC (AmiA/AmiB activator)